MTFENEMIRHIEKDEIEYLQFKRLLKYKNINHAYILKTHDISFRCGTGFRLIDNVKSNLKKMCDNCGFDYNTIVRPDYNHTNNVAIINEVDISKEVPELRGERFKDTDGLITDKSNITLMSTNADCNLIFLYDPKKDVIANVHAGWKGTFNKILKNAIEKMTSEYGSNPLNIEAYLCPSIRKCHYEVDEDLKEKCYELFEYTGRLDEIISQGEIKDGKQKYFLDLLLINKIVLEECGVIENNITDCGICSVCFKEKIHSKRAEGLEFGLDGAFICKK